MLIRNDKGVKPTDNALKIIPVLREIIRQEEKLYQINSEIKGLAVGRVTIGAYSSIATHWLPSVIKGFQENFPQIEIQLMEGIHQEVGCGKASTGPSTTYYLWHRYTIIKNGIPCSKEICHICNEYYS